jgi:hypothetical protein
MSSKRDRVGIGCRHPTSLLLLKSLPVPRDPTDSTGSRGVSLFTSQTLLKEVHIKIDRNMIDAHGDLCFHRRDVE